MKKIYLFGLVVFLIFLALVVLAATIFTDDFESYNTGDLHGQGGWNGHSGVDVVDTVYYEGGKGVKIAFDGSQDYAAKDGDTVTDGVVGVYFMRDTDNHTGAGNFYVLDSSTSTIYNVRITQGGEVEYYDGSGWQDVGVYDLATWYLLELEWRSSDNQFRCRLTEMPGTPGEWGAWDTGTTSNTPDKIAIASGSGSGSADNIYFDYIHEPTSAEEEEEFTALLVNSTWYPFYFSFIIFTFLIGMLFVIKV